jgi:plasmid stabilization system protein ParE
MAAALVRSSLFLIDYREIALRIGKENSDAADRFCTAVETALDLLSQHPQLGRFAHFASASSVRRWVLQPFPNYVIYYEDRPGEILLVRLLHGARDAPPFLG